MTVTSFYSILRAWLSEIIVNLPTSLDDHLYIKAKKQNTYGILLYMPRTSSSDHPRNFKNETRKKHFCHVHIFVYNLPKYIFRIVHETCKTVAVLVVFYTTFCHLAILFANVVRVRKIQRVPKKLEAGLNFLVFTPF